MSSDKPSVFAQASPEQVHRALAFKRMCHFCGGVPVVRIRVLAPLDEMMARNPELLLEVAAGNPDHPGGLPTVPIRDGGTVKPYLMVSDVTACSACRKDALHAAAKGPSWVITEIDEGPGPSKVVVGG